MDKYFIEIGQKSLQKRGQEVCGDVFLSRKLQEEGRTIAVLSDGLGSGIKANVLATMTASMALNFTMANQPVERSAESIRNTLPVDEERKINYASFTIADIEYDGETSIIEYGNPQFLLFRGAEPLAAGSIQQSKANEIELSRFIAQKEDRIILFSDGVSQSGIGRADMPFGWDMEDIQAFIAKRLHNNPQLSAQELAQHIVNQAYINDALAAQDDITCSVIYFRKPRNLLICTGPPYNMERDKTMAETVTHFPGAKIICGGTTAQIISRELERDIDIDLSSGDLDLPPTSAIEGIDLVTEGILTIGKVAEWLEKMNLRDINYKSPAGRLIHYLLANDKITFLVGTRINDAHQDPALPVELEIRRNVIKKVARLLDEKYLKEVHIQFI
ncbi:MAG: SpoIIE family protein phosphatase [Bacteroidales bacterium]